MNARELRAIIDGGESSTVEFKRKATTPEKIAKELSALANTKGGVVLFGVDDDGKVYGIASEKSEMDLIDTAANFHISPALEIDYEFASIHGRDILVVTVPESNSKPHKVLIYDEVQKKHVPRAYIRVGEKSVIASSEMSRLMSYQNKENDSELTLSIGDKEKRLFDYLEKYERATVIEFSNMVNISRRRAERLLIRLVRAKVIKIHNDSHHDYFTLVW